MPDMTVDPPKVDPVMQLLQEVDKTLQENRRFLEALKHDRLSDSDGMGESDDSGDEVFEEL